MWHDFEVRHGNEDTFREMLRIKRSVQAQFNTQVRIFFSQVKPIVLSLSGIVFSELCLKPAPFVQNMDTAIHRIHVNHYSVEKS